MTHRRPLRPAARVVALLAASALIGACSGSDATTSTSGSAADALAAADARDMSNGDASCDDGPEQSGEDGAAVVEIVESAAAEAGLSSVVYRVTRGEDVVAAGAVGDSLPGVPATQSMHFRNGNVAFAYLGTLLLLMVEDGEVALEDPVGEWLPELDLPDDDVVTLEMLARSTSGYPDYVPNDDFNEPFIQDPFRTYTAQELIDIGLSTPPWYEPGTSWNYAHTNYVILGEALAAAGGAPLDELLSERVIGPMGLEDTAAATTPAVPEPVLHSYSTERDVLEDTTFWNPSWQTAPGSVITTNMCDLATSARAVGTGELLDEDSHAAMLATDTAELGEPPSSCPERVCRQFDGDRYYGLGVIVMDGWIVQTPLFGGAGAVHAYLPAEDLAVGIVAVTGEISEVGVNHGERIWQALAEELTPEHLPAR